MKVKTVSIELEWEGEPLPLKTFKKLLEAVRQPSVKSNDLILDNCLLPKPVDLVWWVRWFLIGEHTFRYCVYRMTKGNMMLTYPVEKQLYDKWLALTLKDDVFVAESSTQGLSFGDVFYPDVITVEDAHYKRLARIEYNPVSGLPMLDDLNQGEIAYREYLYQPLKKIP